MNVKNLILFIMKVIQTSSQPIKSVVFQFIQETLGSRKLKLKYYSIEFILNGRN